MKRIFPLLLLITHLSGCATYYKVRVNDYLNMAGGAAVIPAAGSFSVLENKNEKNPILEAEVKSKIERMLTEKGYRVVPYEKADMCLDFSYSINSGRTVSEVRPVYNPGDVETVQTFRSNGRSSTSIVTLPGYTTYLPYSVTVYTSSLIMNVLDATSLRDRNEKKILWIGENYVCSESPDLRNMINYLLVASFEHFGENTGKSVIMNLSEKDQRVKKISQ